MSIPARDRNELEVQKFIESTATPGKPGVAVANPDGSNISGDKTPYITNLQVNAGNSKLTYVGKADAGSATSAAVWQITRLDETTGLIILRAGGNADFSHIFDDRESLSYE